MLDEVREPCEEPGDGFQEEMQSQRNAEFGVCKVWAFDLQVHCAKGLQFCLAERWRFEMALDVLKRFDIIFLRAWSVLDKYFLENLELI